MIMQLSHANFHTTNDETEDLASRAFPNGETVDTTCHLAWLKEKGSDVACSLKMECIDMMKKVTKRDGVME